jgi:hypothetical protein
MDVRLAADGQIYYSWRSPMIANPKTSASELGWALAYMLEKLIGGETDGVGKTFVLSCIPDDALREKLDKTGRKELTMTVRFMNEAFTAAEQERIDALWGYYAAKMQVSVAYQGESTENKR